MIKLYWEFSIMNRNRELTIHSNPGLSTSAAKDTWLESSWPGLLSPEKEKKPINIGAKSTNNRTKFKEYFWQNNPKEIARIKS